MKHLLLIFSAVALCMSVVRAQEQPLPDPSELFTDAVEVVNVEVESSASEAEYAPQLDYQRRIITVYDTESEQWREYPYPRDINLVQATRRPNGMVLVMYGDDGDYERNIYVDFLLELDPARGIYARPLAVCDEFLQPLPGETGEWAVYQGTLCNTATGQTYRNLPDGIVWRDISVSPDEDWIALLGLDQNNAYVIYAFQASTQRLNYMGILTHEDNNFGTDAGLSRWASNILGSAYEGCTRNWCLSYMHTFDVTQPNSLERFTVNYPSISTPNGFVRVRSLLDARTGSPTIGEGSACYYFVYDDQGARSYDMGYDCRIFTTNDYGIGGIEPYQNGILYLKVNEDTRTFPSLVYLDGTNGNTQVLLEGELEALLSASPNGGYAAVVIGNNDQIEPSEYYLLMPEITSFSDDSQIGIVDLNSGSVVYMTETASSGEIVWLSDDTVLIVMEGRTRMVSVAPTGDSTIQNLPPSARLIQLNHNGTTSAQVVYTGWSLFVDHSNGAFLRRSELVNNRIVFGSTLIDFAEGRAISLFRTENIMQAELNVDGTIIATIYLNDPRCTITYTLRLREDATP